MIGLSKGHSDQLFEVLATCIDLRLFRISKLSSFLILWIPKRCIKVKHLTPIWPFLGKFGRNLPLKSSMKGFLRALKPKILLFTYFDLSLSLVIKKLNFDPFISLKVRRKDHFFQNTYPYLASISWFSSNLALICCKIWPKWASWSFPQHFYWLKTIPRHLWSTFFPMVTIREPKGGQLQWPREPQSSELRASKSKSKYKSGFVIRNFQLFGFKPHELR